MPITRGSKGKQFLCLSYVMFHVHTSIMYPLIQFFTRITPYQEEIFLLSISISSVVQLPVRLVGGFTLYNNQPSVADNNNIQVISSHYHHKTTTINQNQKVCKLTQTASKYKAFHMTSSSTITIINIHPHQPPLLSKSIIFNIHYHQHSSSTSIIIIIINNNNIHHQQQWLASIVGNIHNHQQHTTYSINNSNNMQQHATTKNKQ